MCENEKLIDLVRCHSFLYDTRHEDYGDIAKKNEAWAEIAIKMGFKNAAAAKNKWRYLRDYYAKHLRAQSNTLEYRNKKYKHWTWAARMDFLKPYVSSTHEDQSSHTEIQSDSDLDTNKIKVEPSQEDAVQDYDESQDESTSGSSQRSKSLETSNFNISEDAIECLQTGRIQKTFDAIDLLFLSYAQTLKTFSPRKRATVKLQIAEIINCAEMAQLEEQDPLQLSPSPSPSS